MALPRKKIPMDSPNVIAAREMQKPLDWTKVEPRDSDDKKRWHYKWCYVGEYNQSKAKAIGYVIVSPEEVETPNAYADTTGGKIRVADTVLMKLPMHIAKERGELQIELRQRAVRRELETSVDAAASVGVRVKHRVAKSRTLTRDTAENFDDNEEETVLEVGE